MWLSTLWFLYWCFIEKYIWEAKASIELVSGNIPLYLFWTIEFTGSSVRWIFSLCTNLIFLIDFFYSNILVNWSKVKIWLSISNLKKQPFFEEASSWYASVTIVGLFYFSTSSLPALMFKSNFYLQINSLNLNLWVPFVPSDASRVLCSYWFVRKWILHYVGFKEWLQHVCLWDA